MAVVGDVIVKIDAPDAEEMQFKGHGDDEDSKKEEKEQESPVRRSFINSITRKDRSR